MRAIDAGDLKEYFLFMKKVSYQVLKKNLSKCLDEAEAGEEILVTRHEKPVAFLTSVKSKHLVIGSRFGKAKLVPHVAKPAGKALSLEVLLEDRRGGRER